MSDAICIDCRTDLDPDPLGPFGAPVAEYFYLVHDRIWRQAGMTAARGSFLCVGCLELRLGRELQGEDFKDSFTNRPQRQDSPRLADRKSRKDWSASESQGPFAQLAAEYGVPKLPPRPMLRRRKKKANKRRTR